MDPRADFIRLGLYRDLACRDRNGAKLDLHLAVRLTPGEITKASHSSLYLDRLLTAYVPA